MYINRIIDNYLQQWCREKKRKPLLIHGARQVGKSSSIRNLAKSFDYFIEVNFEQNRKVHSYFDDDLDVKEICDQISVQYKKPIIPNKTLLFFDEIQACPRAITALRYFYENYANLHVIAAGSLLEFALEKLSSFGVGRIESVYMYPFSFQEFMIACGEELLWKEVCKASPEKPMISTFHESCIALLKKYLVLGGMPAVVSEYVQNKNTLAAQKELINLISSLKSDFSKYKQRVPELRIATVFESVVRQSGGNFNYAKVESLNYRQVRESLELLQKAGLVIPVICTSANGIPLGAETNYRKQKMILLDTGIFQSILGLEIADLLLSNDFEVINKGAIAEQFVGLELLKSASCYMPQNLYFWTREKANSSAEVDYLVQKGEKIIPIEVKSGKSGKMQSMHLFLNEKNAAYGIRTSLENFGQYDKIKVYPLYAIGSKPFC